MTPMAALNCKHSALTSGPSRGPAWRHASGRAAARDRRKPSAARSARSRTSSGSRSSKRAEARAWRRRPTRERIVLGYADAVSSASARELEDELRNRPHGPTPRFRAGDCRRACRSHWRTGSSISKVSHRPDSPRIDLSRRRVDNLLRRSRRPSAGYRAGGPADARESRRPGAASLLGECGTDILRHREALARRHKGSFPQLVDGAPLPPPGE